MPITASDIPDGRKFSYQMDPQEIVNFEAGFEQFLDDGVTVSSATSEAGSAATTAGLAINNTTVSDPKVTVQFEVPTESDQSDAAYDPPGTELTFQIVATLSNGEIRKRSLAFTAVRQ